jgi:hypothetical protein
VGARDHNRTGREVVLGEGGRPPLHLEIVGYDSTNGPCIWIVLTALPRAAGSCGSSSESLPPEGQAIALSDRGAGGFGKGRSFSEVDGVLIPRVAEVRLSYRYRGSERHARAVVARVNHRLLAVMHQKRPYGYFAAIFRGCVSSDVEAVAFDAKGHVLESTVSPESPFGPICPLKGP